MSAGILVRPERKDDRRAAEEVTREAFWNLHSPGCNEHYLLHLLRESGAFIGALDWVAEKDGRVAGSIVYSRSKILGDDGRIHAAITFGPVAVLPALQGKGIGSLLIRRTLEEARKLGHQAVLIYGDPAYYARFGFQGAERFDIRSHDNCYADALEALELSPGALSGRAGRFSEDAIFDMDEAAAEAFDRSFPPKVKLTGLPSQARFLEVAGRRRAR
ncbi:MAG: N-acetyltransferase [Eubacteriales bacterium]|nr:N-acetyltransferase [Eubacteriales bacterium]NLO12931.1 N-acetyltransferase [Clostridiales bacterium]